MSEPDDQQQDRLTSEALDWLSRLSLGDLTQNDLADLRSWRDASPAHAAALTRAGDLWRVLNDPVAELAKQRLSRKTSVMIPSRRAVLIGGGAMAAAAAGVMIVRPPLELWPSFAELAADYRTGTGERRQLALSDAVSVELNTRTSIAVRDNGQGRSIELISGETAVNIPHAMSNAFNVFAAEGSARSSRGAFNIRRRDIAVEVACIEGDVDVQCDGRDVTLQAGQRVAYGNQGIGEISGADVPVLTSWRGGMLIFRNTPLAAVIDEVNRYRSGRIVLVDAALAQRLVSARFEINRLDMVMSQISQVFKVPVRSFPGGIVLVG
jgi:transmembrane sensor